MKDDLVHPAQLWKDLNRRYNELFMPPFSAGIGTWGKEHGLAGEQWLPAADIREEDDKYVVSMDLPGVEPEDIHVVVSDGMLTVRGMKESEKETKKGDTVLHERHSGEFVRRFRLPGVAESEDIVATSKHGELRLELPRVEASKPKRVKVDVHS